MPFPLPLASPRPKCCTFTLKTCRRRTHSWHCGHLSSILRLLLPCCMYRRNSSCRPVSYLPSGGRGELTQQGQVALQGHLCTQEKERGKLNKLFCITKLTNELTEYSLVIRFYMKMLTRNQNTLYIKKIDQESFMGLHMRVTELCVVWINITKRKNLW